jgi:hypothetical protein
MEPLPARNYVAATEKPLRHKPRRFRRSYSLVRAGVRAGSHRLRARLQSEERSQTRVPVPQDIPCQVDPRRNVS